nr:hypothetical protein Iba_chr08aCG5610 [Ipomoea batatas]GMD23454.1 hypothetical protein Iba_chr08bCG5440 [Ipomoea batatas]GMD26616.1 hypothetical protein Iba_chr08dCG5970 [Ipomoea batatas]GME19718.1 hypothetical protein Iba_scaffold23609CG0020 [Ipomoea batatas]
MGAMRGQAVKANGLATVQAKYILFILSRIFVSTAAVEELLCKKSR